jgi:outer membrane protein OmpA-like peptidoglycan-associated protein
MPGRGRGLTVLLVAAACWVAGCAQTPRVAAPAHDEMVVLLPGADGKTGALTVTHAGQQATLDQAYATARVKEAGAIDRSQADPTAVRGAFAAALSAQPPRPVTFRLYFLGDSDDFTPESKQEIQKIFPEIAAHPAPEIVVVGHTDRVGSIAYNDALSLRRAERVRNDLVQLGIPRDRITIAGRGEREPVVPTEDEVAEPRNRRVEITVR